MTLVKNTEQTFKFEYDFSVDGGAVSSITMRNLGVNPIPVGAIIEGAQLQINTAFTSGGSATVVLGFSGATSDLFATVFAQTGVINAGIVASTLLWDNTNDINLNYTTTASQVTPLLTIGTAALTAGKCTLILKARLY